MGFGSGSSYEFGVLKDDSDSDCNRSGGYREL